MFEDFNNSDSYIYKKNLAIMNAFIDEKLKQSKSDSFHNKTKICGTIEDITKFCSTTARAISLKISFTHVHCMDMKKKCVLIVRFVTNHALKKHIAIIQDMKDLNCLKRPSKHFGWTKRPP